MIFAVPAPNIYEAQNRIAGWKHTPTSKESLRQLKALVPRLKQLGIERVVYAELDRATGEWLARRLNVPYEGWDSLNRFNAGKSHGLSAERWQKLMSEMETVWSDKPDVPVKGGDSLTSFTKRVAASREKLAKAQPKTLVVAPKQVVEKLLDASGALPYRLYEASIG